MGDFAKSFERRLLSALKTLGLESEKIEKGGTRIGIAVSGGADSTALLCAVCSLFQKAFTTLSVLTVNHNIRAREECIADALYVEECCKKLGSATLKIDFCLKTLEPGAVKKEKNVRQMGEEEAARHLRYKAFEEFIAEKGIDCLLTAHTASDVAETFLMKILTGTSFNFSARRGKFFRPMLSFEKNEIKKYLLEKGMIWREDSTNEEEKYLRNRVRKSLIPVLDSKFPGWKKGISTFREKFFEDEISLWRAASLFPLKSENDEVSFNMSLFQKEEVAIKRRILKRAFRKIGIITRVSEKAVNSFLRGIEGTSPFTVTSGGIEMRREKEEIKIRAKRTAEEEFFGFFAILRECAVYRFPFGSVKLEECGGEAEKVLLTVSGEKGSEKMSLSLPICVRSRQIADEVSSEGSAKSVTSLFDSWKIPENKRNFVPIITTKRGEILAIIGSVLGYKNRIVKEK